MTAPAMSHERALDIATLAPAFRPAEHDARALATHLAACPDCAHRVARLRTDLAAIGRIDPPVSPQLHDRIREAAVTAPRTGPNLAGIVLLFALVAVALIGTSIGVGALQGTRLPAPPAEGPVLPVRDTDSIRWRTDVVALSATDLWIDADGIKFRAAGGATVTSDPGDPTRWTLEASWFEQGRQQRFYLDFAADAQSWWITQVRVYDGDAVSPTWVTIKPVGPQIAEAPLGMPYEGVWQFTDVPSATGPVSITMNNVRIAVRPQDNVNDLPGSRKLTGDGQNPFNPGGSLHCSGILQMPPRAAEARLLALGYALSWRLERKTGSNTGFSEAAPRAPATGFISDTAVGSSGELIVFVEDPTAPFGDAATLPPDCAAGS